VSNPATDVLLREWLLRQLGLFPGVSPSGVPEKSSLGDASWPLYLAATGANLPADVTGRFTHTVQSAAVDGSDNFDIQGDAGAGFASIVGQTGLVANGFRTFTGAYRSLKVLKNSGTGVATTVYLTSIR